MEVIKKINKAKTVWQVLLELTPDDLEQAIKVASESYYNSGISLVDDQIYDILVERLRKIKPQSKILKQTGAPVKGKKEKLPYWMGSMDKIKSDEKLINNWTKVYKGPYVVSDKLDGISCLLAMTDGEITLYTRGDGVYGQNITHLLELVNMSVGDLVKIGNKDVAIRGELIMTKENFEKKYKNEMSNARNMVAGIVNSKKESVNKKYARDVDFISYEVIEPILKPSDQLKLLKKWGLNVAYHDTYEDINLSILDGVLQKRKKKSVYEIDGVIITDDHKHSRNISGNPPYSFAYKGLTETADTKVVKVVWRPSKDGIVVPTIFYKKVRLSQADLHKTNGFNAKFILNNKIGPGAIITIIRSGDVIPYIMDVVKPASKASFPTHLKYEWDENKVNIVLLNPDDDKDVIIRRLTKFVTNIGVENLSEGLVARLVEAGYDTIPKIMELTVDDFLSIDGFKDTLATKLYNNLQASLQRLDILTLMVASNVFGRGFGDRKIKKILDNYPNIVNEYSKKNHTEWQEKLRSLEGFEIKTVNYFLDALPEFQEFYKNVSKIVSVKPHKIAAKKEGGFFKGAVVVMTGFREQSWKNFIETEGGKVTESVSKNTTLLVYNDGETTTSKFLKAKELGIKTMSRSEFAKKYNIE